MARLVVLTEMVLILVLFGKYLSYVNVKCLSNVSMSVKCVRSASLAASDAQPESGSRGLFNTNNAQQVIDFLRATEAKCHSRTVSTTIGHNPISTTIG